MIQNLRNETPTSADSDAYHLGNKAMTTENLAETTDQQEEIVDEQSQGAVSSTDEATVQESQVQEEESRNKTPEWVQRRFNEMTRDRHEAQRKADAAIQEAATYRQLVEAMRNGEETPNQPVVKAPVNDDERIREAAQKLNQAEQFNTRCNSVYETGKAEFPDFEQAVQNLGMLGVTQEFLAGAVGLDDAHKVLHALGSNPDEASRILSLPALQQGRELERLASKAPAKVVKPVSRAPAPISTTVDGSGGSTKDPSKMTMEEFAKWRNSQPRKR